MVKRLRKAASWTTAATVVVLPWGVIPTVAAAPLPHPVQQASRPNDYQFPGQAGALLFYVRPERSSDFEGIVAKLSGVLDASADPIRRQQAAAWRMYRSLEPAREMALYVFFFDPVVGDSDYDPVKVLGEALPAEAQSLFERLKADVIRVERLSLARLR